MSPQGATRHQNLAQSYPVTLEITLAMSLWGEAKVGPRKVCPISNPRKFLSAGFLMLDPWMPGPGLRRGWSKTPPAPASLSKGYQLLSSLCCRHTGSSRGPGYRELVLWGDQPQQTESRACNCLCV